MANQPKKYKKFVATAATATLVASAIVPVASAAHNDTAGHQFESYINEATKLGLFNDGGEFKPQNKLTRKHVVLILGRYLEDAGKKPAADYATNPAFTDLGTADAEYIRLASVVKEAGIFSGDNGKINGAQNISRQHMAKVLDGLAKAVTGTSLVEAAKDIEDAKVTDLDAAGASYRDAIQALADFGVTTVEKFNPKGDVTRGQFAKFIMETIGAVKKIEAGIKPDATKAIKAVTDAVAALPKVENVTKETATADAAKVKAVTDAVAALEKLVATATDLSAEDKEKAVATIKAGKEAAAKVEAAIEATKPVAVSAVSAVNATTLTVTGEGLKNLKASDITVPTNTVAAVTASADGKSATVTLGAALIPNQEYKVNVKVGEATKEFTVKHALAATTVSVDAKAYDDDTANQFVSFNVNGKPADLNDLFVNGYTVSFAATKVNASGATENATAELFGTNTSTGLLLTNLKAGSEYKVQVTIAKGSDIIVSERAEIKIVNNQLAATAIKSLKATNNKGTTSDTTDDFVLASSTLVVGESLTFDDLVAVQNGIDTLVDNTALQAAITAGTASVVSSNPAVASVSSTGVVTANTPGTTTVTVTYGKATKVYNLTVAQAKRELSKIEAKSFTHTTTLTSSINPDFTFVARDQFGDPIQLAASGYSLLIQDPSIVDPTAANTKLSATNVKGEGKLTIKGLKVGTTSIAIKNSKNVTVGSVAVTVTQNETISNQKFELQQPSAAQILAGQSPDLTLDKATEKEIHLELVSYTSENVKIGAESLENYTVKFDKDVVAVKTGAATADASGDYKIVSTDKELVLVPSATADAKLGYTDIQLYDKENKLVGTQRVTLVDNTPKLTAVAIKQVPAITFAGKTLNYKDVLTITETAGDDIVSGVTLSVPANSVVRIAETTQGDVAIGDLYLDVNGDGKYMAAATDKDIKLGSVSIAATSDSNSALTTALGSKTILDTTTIASKSKGTLIIRVTNTTPAIVSSSSITVNVPE